ncbi:MAG TPA: hypothetical protein VF384_09960, partial [Planctomycetota bacterium]
MTPTNRIASIAILSALVLATAETRAQSTLALDGQVSVIRRLGDAIAVTVTGQVGQPVGLMLDTDPGPVTLFGLTVPLGFTSAFVLANIGTIPAGGTLTVQIGIPYREGLHSQKFYLAALSLDSTAPQGLAISNGVDVTVVARPQLAGNPLPTFPFFEHISAVNRASPVSLAIDPRYSYVVGKTAHVYVVADKTAAQWAGNPALTDVRGAPQTVTFPVGATTIQQNTFLLDNGSLLGPNETAGSGDIRIGVGYDVVIDFGQDGQFTEGVDMIDGYEGSEAGFYVCRNLQLGGTVTTPNAGPYPVTAITYTGGTFLGQKTYYPTNIATLGLCPLVVVSHGNGHQYIWYDHIGFHLASYGFVVMSHQNDTVPGSHTAAITTLTNTDYLLGNLATIGGGVMLNHVDGDNITWIGHSRGGDGVARAYDNLFRSAFTPVNYSITDIKLVSSIAPVDFGGWSGQSPTLGGTGNGSHPHDANFHLWVAEGDSDVNGCAGAPQVFWYGIHERATRKRQSISLYGVGHGDYHAGGGNPWFSGPNPIGAAATHNIMRPYLLALVSHHIRGDIPSRDYLWRQYESFRAVGAPAPSASVVVNMMFQDDAQSGKYVIDDFQSQSFASPNVAACGANVSVGVQAFVEGRNDDANGDFTDNINDPFNGFTMDEFAPGSNGPQRSDSFGCVFSFSGAPTSEIAYDLSTATNRPNFGAFPYLSFRAAQASRHPLTTALPLGDVTFQVVLEDGAGHQGVINIGAY